MQTTDFGASHLRNLAKNSGLRAFLENVDRVRELVRDQPVQACSDSESGGFEKRNRNA